MKTLGWGTLVVNGEEIMNNQLSLFLKGIKTMMGSQLRLIKKRFIYSSKKKVNTCKRLGSIPSALAFSLVIMATFVYLGNTLESFLNESTYEENQKVWANYGT